MEFRTDDGAVVVEGAEDTSGSRLVARADGTVAAARTFEGSLEGVRATAESALRVFRDGSLRPDSVEIEFGVRLTAEAGALIAKSAVEGHLLVKLSWSPERRTAHARTAHRRPAPRRPPPAPRSPPRAHDQCFLARQNQLRTGHRRRFPRHRAARPDLRPCRRAQ
ncbi:CU044_2847 family protein [Streptomyces sp. NPDC006285]|uniref:CU044_2847 family protein n=1 Tax=Streptomyces sp. NPDC006285 TaxID=3364742 RepID=UPI00369F7A8D